MEIEIIRGDVLTAEMKRRAPMVMGIRGGFNFETPDRKTVLADLVKRGFIETWQEDYVWTFLELRSAWLLKSGYKNNSLYANALLFFGAPEGRAGEIYDLVVHEIGGNTVKIIQIMLDEAHEMHIAEIEVYRIATDNLTKAMDDVKKSLAVAMQKM